MLLNMVWLSILLRITGPEIVYRFVAYLLASSVANSMVSTDRRQIPVYASISIAVYLVIALALYAPLFKELQSEFRTSFITTLMLVTTVNIILLFTNRLSNELMDLAEREMELNRRKALDLAELLSGQECI